MKKNLQDTIAKLAKMNEAGRSRSGNGKFYSIKKGKNNLLVLPLTDDEDSDPFAQWNVHRNLLSKPYFGIACPDLNHGKECSICKVVQDLQKANWKGNKVIWEEIEVFVQFYSPVIDLDDTNAGVQWWGYGKSVLKQFQKQIMNLEDDEAAFYELDDLQKVVVDYDKEAAAQDRYSVSFKELKKLPFDDDQLDDWMESISEIDEVCKRDIKDEDTIIEALAAFTEKMQDVLDAIAEKADDKSEAKSEKSEAKSEKSDSKDDSDDEEKAEPKAPRRSRRKNKLESLKEEED